MEGDKFIINSNNSCLMCFGKLVKVNCDNQTQSLFPIHRLTHKLDFNLGNVFPDVKSEFGEDFSQLLDQLHLFCDLCQDCANICEKLEQSILSLFDDEVKVQAKRLIYSITKVKLSQEYKSALQPLALIHFGIVRRLRDEIETGLKMLLDNPLENDVVITNVLSFLRIEDVRKCRLINKQWNNNSIRILKQISSPWLNLVESRIGLMKQLEIFSLLESGSELPLASWIYTSTIFLEDVNRGGNLFRFFDAVSPKMTDLEICVYARSDVYVNHDLGYPKGLTFPHLTSIYFVFDNKLRRFSYFELFRGIIQNSPNLTDIMISPTTYSSSIPTSAFQPMINLLREGQLGNRLTWLSLGNEDWSPSSTQYDQLAEIGLKLKKFQASPTDSTVVSIGRFLKTQSNSLEELEVYFKHAQFKLERMARLKLLKVNYGMDETWKLNQCIFYKRLFPVLEELHLVVISRRGLDIFLHFGRGESDIGNSVKRLYLRDELSPRDIENAAHLFPNLTKLEICPAELETLKVVYERMQHLQELILSLYGTRRGEINNILMGVEQEEVESNDTHFNPHKSLIALTELKILRIKGMERNIIGKEVCRRVFMKMKSLKFIKFYDQYRRKSLTEIGISNSLLDEMRKKMMVIAAYVEH